MLRHTRTLLLLLGAAMPLAGQARGRPCLLDLEHAELMQSYPQGGGRVTRYLSGDVRFRCAGQNIHLRGDSLVSFDDYDTFSLIGNVTYRDDEYVVTTDRLNRFRVGERLELRGNAVVRRLRDSTMLEAPWIDYFRAEPGVNPVARLLTDGGTRTTIFPDSTPGTPVGNPWLLTSYRQRMIGEHQVEAWGNAQLLRDSLRVTGDSLRYDSDTLRLAQVWGKPGRAVDFSSDSMRLDGHHLWIALDSAGQVEEVRAMAAARLVREGGTVTGDTIIATVTNRHLDGLVAWSRGTSPAHLARDGYDATGDSLVVNLRADRLQQLRVFGHGRVEQPVDSLLLHTPADSAGPPLRDWLSGETILVTFADVDSAGTILSVIRQLNATRNSCSLASRRQAAATPGERTPLSSLNYACADTIVIEMLPGLQRDIDTIHFRGNMVGAIMQPDAGTAPGTRPTGPGAGAIRRPGGGQEITP